MLDLETQLIVSILNILLLYIANHDLIASPIKYLNLYAKVVIAVEDWVVGFNDTHTFSFPLLHLSADCVGMLEQIL